MVSWTHGPACAARTQLTSHRHHFSPTKVRAYVLAWLLGHLSSTGSRVYPTTSTISFSWVSNLVNSIPLKTSPLQKKSSDEWQFSSGDSSVSTPRGIDFEVLPSLQSGRVFSLSPTQRLSSLTTPRSFGLRSAARRGARGRRPSAAAQKATARRPSSGASTAHHNTNKSLNANYSIAKVNF